VAVAPSARAAEALLPRTCTTDNLIARKPAGAAPGPARQLWLVTDEAVAHRGSAVGFAVAVVLDTPARLGHLRFSASRRWVSAFYVQADANDTYKIFGSLDGTPNSFNGPCRPVEMVQGHGLRGPHGERQPDPGALRAHRRGAWATASIRSRSSALTAARRRTFPAAVPQGRCAAGTRARIAVVEVLLVGQRGERALRDAARAQRMALILWGIGLRAKNTPDEQAKLRRRLLMLVGVLSFGAYWNFGFFHFRKLHPHLGHVSLLRRLEVLPRAVVRSPVRMRIAG